MEYFIIPMPQIYKQKCPFPLQVQLIPYKPNFLDESILWTESKDLGDGFRAVRMVNNIRLNVDAFHGDKYSGGVHDGTIIVLWEWNKGDNQRWRITPYCKFPKTKVPSLKKVSFISLSLSDIF